MKEISLYFVIFLIIGITAQIIVDHHIKKEGGENNYIHEELKTIEY